MVRPALMLGLWLLGLVFAVASGVLGGLVWELIFGAYANHVIKSCLAIVWMLFLGWLHARYTKGPSAMAAAWTAGITWLCLTVAFEFLAGHYIFGNSWEVLIADYQIWSGRFWIAVLAALLLGPALMAWLIRSKAKTV